MLLEVLTTVALLCQLNGPTNIKMLEVSQSECQAWYVSCIEDTLSVEKCIDKRSTHLLLDDRSQNVLPLD